MWASPGHRILYRSRHSPCAREIKRRIDAYQEAYGERPRVILMQTMDSWPGHPPSR